MCLRVCLICILISLITLQLWAGTYRDDFDARRLRKDWGVFAHDYPEQPERAQIRRVPVEKVSMVNQGRLTLDASFPQEAQFSFRSVTLFFFIVGKQRTGQITHFQPDFGSKNSGNRGVEKYQDCASTYVSNLNYVGGLARMNICKSGRPGLRLV